LLIAAEYQRKPGKAVVRLLGVGRDVHQTGLRSHTIAGLCRTTGKPRAGD
jgi:hypothetical protein